MCHMLTRSVNTSTANMAAADIWTHCDAISVQRRSRRSASTPPIGVKSNRGICCKNASRPRKNGEPVIDSTSQFSATACVQVPTLETQEPNHRSRKSRYLSDTVARAAARPTPARFSKLPSVAGCADAVGITRNRSSRSNGGAAASFETCSVPSKDEAHMKARHLVIHAVWRF